MSREVLLSTVAYGVPSGNYDGSSQDWYSDGVKAAGYYRGRNGLQTATFRVQNLVGTITVEATLDADPSLATWFEVTVFGDAVIPVTDTHPVTITGNFTWLRAHVQGFDAGTIEYVIVDY